MQHRDSIATALIQSRCSRATVSMQTRVTKLRNFTENAGTTTTSTTTTTTIEVVMVVVVVVIVVVVVMVVVV